LDWFNKAEEFIKRENPYKELITENTQIKKVLLVNYPNPSGAVETLRRRGIEVIEIERIIKELIKSVREREDEFLERGTGATGKELDLLRYFIKTLIDRKLLKE